MSDYQQQPMDQEEQYNGEYDNGQQYNGEYDNLDYDIDFTYNRSLSSDRPYNVYEFEQIIKRLKKQINNKQQLSCLSYGWALMLYYLTDFSQDYFDNVMDQQQTGRKMIKYTQNYFIEPIVGVCTVCYQTSDLLNNVCGHRFCLNCWKYHLQLHHNDRNNYELFPMCQQQNCFHRTNYYLMEYLWQKVPQLQNSFHRLLCIKYSQKSLQVKVCPKQKCCKIIYINDRFTNDPIICDCKTNLCKLCGHYNHFPLQCFDLKYWQNFNNKRQNQWVNALALQSCPMCKQQVQKDPKGCLHMTCICKYQFCWICLKVWKNHSNFYKCGQTTRQQHILKLQKEKEKRMKDENLYNERYQQTKCLIQRLQNLNKKRYNFKQQKGQQFKQKLKLLKILQNDANIFNELIDFTKQAWRIQQNFAIYLFFEKQNSKNYQKIIKVISKASDQMDDFVDKYQKIIDKIDQIKEGQQQNNQRSKFLNNRERYYQLLNQSSNTLQQIKKGQMIQNILFDIKKSKYLSQINSKRQIDQNQKQKMKNLNQMLANQANYSHQSQ